MWRLRRRSSRNRAPSPADIVATAAAAAAATSPSFAVDTDIENVAMKAAFASANLRSQRSRETSEVGRW